MSILSQTQSSVSLERPGNDDRCGSKNLQRTGSNSSREGREANIGLINLRQTSDKIPLPRLPL